MSDSVSFEVEATHIQAAAHLAHVASLQGQNTVLENVLLCLDDKNLSLCSSNSSTIFECILPLVNGLPEIEGNALSFLVKASSLANLTNKVAGASCFTVNIRDNSLTYKQATSNLVLPIKGALDWPNLNTAFETELASLRLPKKIVKEMLHFSKFFMASSQDPHMHLVEIRDGLAITSDRTKFGFFEAADFGDLAFRITGDQVPILDKILDYFPLEITISTTDRLTFITNLDPYFRIGFSGINVSLPVALDQVPYLEEPNKVTSDRHQLLKALARLSVVSSSDMPKVKLDIVGLTDSCKLKLSVVNELGHESTEVLTCERLLSDHQKAYSIVPLGPLQKLLKMQSQDEVGLQFGIGNKYIKIVDTMTNAVSYSVFQSIASLSS